MITNPSSLRLSPCRMCVSSSLTQMEWLEDVEKTLDEADPSSEAQRWGRRCIYRVPSSIKDLCPRAYRPQLVSLGPFHHGDPELQPMEEHKRRALQHLLRRAGRPLMKDLVAAVQGVAEQLESAYGDDLAAEWRGGEGRKRFVAMMVVDGCFLLEVMRATTIDGKYTGDDDDYAPNDPIFSHHGVLYVVPYIRRDMIMLENQLPLLLLEKLLAVETAKPTNGDVINRMVLRFLTPTPRLLPSSGVRVGLHALDMRRRNMLYGPYQHHHHHRRQQVSAESTDLIPSAVEMYESGIRFRRSSTESLHDIIFRHGVLSLPAVTVDDSTEYMLLNMMAFERLHVGAGNDVTAYVFLMDNMINSAEDVALLSSRGIVENAVGSDKAVARLFNTISTFGVMEPGSALDAVHREVNAYCRKPWNVWRANLNHTYFRSPTSFINFLAAVVALVLTVMQTVYTILSFYNQLSSSAKPTEAPAPK